MTDSTVEKWKQNGQIFLWTYLENRRNYPGWHLHADREGADSLLDLFDRMMDAVYPSSKDIHIRKPTPRVLRIPNNRRAKAIAPETFKLKYPKNRVADTYWNLEANERSVILIVGINMLQELKDGVENIIVGRGDYSIGDDNNPRDDDTCLWFWG